MVALGKRVNGFTAISYRLLGSNLLEIAVKQSMAPRKPPGPLQQFQMKNTTQQSRQCNDNTPTTAGASTTDDRKTLSIYVKLPLFGTIMNNARAEKNLCSSTDKQSSGTVNTINRASHMGKKIATRRRRPKTASQLRASAK